MNNRNAVIEKYYIENYDKLVKRVSYRAGGSYNAEDCVSEAFVRAIKYWGSFDPERHELGSWFSTILKNAVKDFNQQEMRYGMCTNIDDEPEIGVATNTNDRDLMHAIYQRIEMKEKSSQDVLFLHFKHQYNPREISEILDVPWENARRLLIRFKNEIKETLVRA